MTWPAGYACAPGLGAQAGAYALRALQWADREPIRRWRNEQIDVLRQVRPLSADEQDTYYRDVIASQMRAEAPGQVLMAFTADGEVVGYGGVVHLAWGDRRGEVSFLTDTARLGDEQFSADWRAYLGMLVPIARDALGLHKLTTETYEVRTNLVPILEEFGFVLEGRLREHHLIDGRWVTSLAHGLLLRDTAS